MSNKGTFNCCVRADFPVTACKYTRAAHASWRGSPVLCALLLSCSGYRMQTHGQPEEEDGWASSDANSEAVQRSAHSTPQAGSTGAFSPPAHQAPATQDADLQVTARSLSAIVTKPKHRQVHSPIAGCLSPAAIRAC